jgi:hypothetical protein
MNSNRSVNKGYYGFHMRGKPVKMMLTTQVSPFEKGGLRGILNNIFINKISPNPSLPKRGIKKIPLSSYK